MMKRYIAVILAYSLVIASSAAAQESVRARVQALTAVPTVPAIPAGTDRIESLLEGQRAGFSGMLLDTDTAIRWTNALRWWPETFQLRAELLASIHSQTVTSYEARLRIVEESYGREILGLRSDLGSMAEQLATALDRPFYDTVMFGAMVGALIVVLIGGVVVGLAVGLR